MTPTSVHPVLMTSDVGRRHSIVTGPGGVLLDVVQPIPPSRECAESDVGGTAELREIEVRP